MSGWDGGLGWGGVKQRLSSRNTGRTGRWRLTFSQLTGASVKTNLLSFGLSPLHRRRSTGHTVGEKSGQHNGLSSSVSPRHGDMWASVLFYLFVELLQLYLNTVLIPLLDALDNPLQVHVHASCAHINTHTHRDRNNHSGHNKIKVTQRQ